MKRLFHLQIFVFVIIVALIGNFNTYAQNKGKDEDIQLNLPGDSKVVPNYTPDNITAVSLPTLRILRLLTLYFHLWAGLLSILQQMVYLFFNLV